MLAVFSLVNLVAVNRFNNEGQSVMSDTIHVTPCVLNLCACPENLHRLGKGISDTILKVFKVHNLASKCTLLECHQYFSAWQRWIIK